MQPYADPHEARDSSAVVRVQKPQYPLALRILSRWIAARHGLDAGLGAVIDRGFAVFEARAGSAT